MDVTCDWLPEEDPFPESVLLIGCDTAEGFRSFAVEIDGRRELPAFTSPSYAGGALRDLGYNPEMVRLSIPLQDVGAMRVPFAEALSMARAQGFGCIGIDIGFSGREGGHRRIPVSAA